MLTSDIDSVYSIEKNAHITPWNKEILRDCVLVGYDCRVISNDKTITGYIISRYADNVLHVLNVCIDETMQGRGYGRLLLDAVFTSLPQHCRAIILEVRPSNVAAIHLYESMGFTQKEVKQGYYKDLTDTEDAIVLEKIVGLSS